MWILKLLKVLGRALVDLLFIILFVVLTSIVLSSVSLVMAFVLAIPIWLACAYVYRALQSIGGQKAQAA
ncbi:MAG: hypothetical protein RIC29_09355 [Rhodospirillaceae bacterium]